MTAGINSLSIALHSVGLRSTTDEQRAAAEQQRADLQARIDAARRDLAALPVPDPAQWAVLEGLHVADGRRRDARGTFVSMEQVRAAVDARRAAEDIRTERRRLVGLIADLCASLGGGR